MPVFIGHYKVAYIGNNIKVFLVMQLDAALKIVANKIGHVVPVLLMCLIRGCQSRLKRKLFFLIFYFYFAVQYVIYRNRDRVFNSMPKGNE